LGKNFETNEKLLEKYFLIMKTQLNCLLSTKLQEGTFKYYKINKKLHAFIGTLHNYCNIALPIK
jgi:hypothetical protein